MNRFLLLPLLLLGFAAGAQTTPAPDNPRIGLGRPAPSSGVVASLNAPPNPLYVVDGQIMDSFQLSDLSPSQIESVNVLKGSKSVALYGDRGKNGVIFVTLKPAMTSR